jgi:hypothetical protein
MSPVVGLWVWVAAVLATPAGLVEHARGALAAAGGALAHGDLDIARDDLAVGWAYVGSPVFARVLGDGERAELVGYHDQLARRLAAARAWPSVKQRHDAAQAALAAAREAAVRRPGRAPAEFARTAEEASSCASLPGEVDEAWEIPGAAGASLAGVARECAELGSAAAAEGERARAAASERDRALRALLKGERLAVYEQRGEPAWPDPSPAALKAMARAPMWTYVVGPRGKLPTYEVLVLSWSGERLVGQKRTVTHDAP